MKKRILSLLLVVFLTSVVMAADPVLDVNQPLVSSALTCNATENLGQSFTQGSGLVFLTSIWVQNYAWEVYPWEVTMELRDGLTEGVGNPMVELPLLASVTKTFTELPADDWYQFDFPNIPVTPGNDYTFLCRGTGTGKAVLSITTYDSYSGHQTYSGDGGAHWAETSYDMTFKTWGLPEPGAAFKASSPTPASPSTVDKTAGATLSWLMGEDAVTHKVYWSDTFEDVNSRSVIPITLAVAIDGNTTPTPSTPVLGTTYYWVVDEVDATPLTADGYLWSYTIGDYIYVDDMEDYNATNPAYNTWNDGYPAAPGLYNGSSVIRTTPGASGTAQALEYKYSNDGTNPAYGSGSAYPYYSEAIALTSDLDCGSDWTADGVALLQLSFKGLATNDANERMYVVIEDGNTPTPNEAMVQYGLPDGYSNPEWEEDMNDIKYISYEEWAIDLRSFTGVNLADVQKVYIGFGERGKVNDGSRAGAPEGKYEGTVVFDEIKLRIPGLHMTKEQFSGDLNNDDTIDFKDLAILANNYLKIEFDGMWPIL